MYVCIDATIWKHMYYVRRKHIQICINMRLENETRKFLTFDLILLILVSIMVSSWHIFRILQVLF